MNIPSNDCARLEKAYVKNTLFSNLKLMPNPLTNEELQFYKEEYPELTEEEIIDICMAVDSDENWQLNKSDD